MRIELLRVDFLKQAVGMPPFIHHVEDITDVDTNATRKDAIEVYVGSQTIPIAIESKTDESSLTVEHRTTGVATSNIVSGQETKL